MAGTGAALLVFSVKVTNVGKQPIIINGYEFLHDDGTTSLFPDVRNQFVLRKLEPYEVLNVTISNTVLQTLIANADHYIEFSIYDTKGKNGLCLKKSSTKFPNVSKKINVYYNDGAPNHRRMA